MRIGSYPSIYNLGHKAIADLFLDPVLVQEKDDYLARAWRRGGSM